MDRRLRISGRTTVVTHWRARRGESDEYGDWRPLPRSFSVCDVLKIWGCVGQCSGGGESNEYGLAAVPPIVIRMFFGTFGDARAYVRWGCTLRMSTMSGRTVDHYRPIW